jgi:hypothetical protein
MTMGIGTEAAQFLFLEYKNRNFFAVWTSPFLLEQKGYLSAPVRTAGQLRQRRLRPYGPRWTQRRRDCSSRPFDLKDNTVLLGAQNVEKSFQNIVS